MRKYIKKKGRKKNATEKRGDKEKDRKRWEKR
jgi:hypothetical protein